MTPNSPINFSADARLWEFRYSPTHGKVWGIQYLGTRDWYISDTRWYTFDDAVKRMMVGDRILTKYRIYNQETGEFVLGAIL